MFLLAASSLVIILFQCVIIFVYYTKFKTYKNDKDIYLKNKDLDISNREEKINKKEDCCLKLKNKDEIYKKFTDDILSA